MINRVGHMKDQRLKLYPLACKNKPKPTTMTSAPKMMPTIAPP